jgi:hypothetical protein
MLRARVSRIGAVLLVSCFAPAVPALAASRANLPDWLRQAAATPLATYPPETKAVEVLNQEDFNVLGPGEFTEHVRKAIRILRQEGRDFGKVSVAFRKGENISYLHAWSIDPSGHEFEVKDKEFIEKGEFDFELYSDFISRVAEVPGSQAGSVIGFEYEIRRHQWINELGWMFQHRIPAAKAMLTIQLPAGWEYRDAWAFSSPVEATRIANNQWQWQLKDVPAIEEEREPMMPPFFSLAGRMSVAYFAPGQNNATAASWQQVGKWYSGLTQDRPVATPEISAKVHQLVPQATDFQTKVQTLTSFLQSEIRYVAISIGVGGFQPHPAGDVFRLRYGDCKDKVTLLKSMLQESGINSHYVLIDTDRGFIRPSVPSAWADHAIIAIELPPGLPVAQYRSVVSTKSGARYLIFDPTDQYTPIGSLRPELQDSYALLVRDSGSELIRTPLLPPDSNMMSRMGNLALSADGNLSGEISEDNSGYFASAKREFIHSTNLHERTNAIEHWMGGSLQGFLLDNVDIRESDLPGKNLLVKYKLTVPQYAQARGPLMLVRPRVLDSKGSFIEHKPRHYPVELRRTGRETDTFEIELPREYQVDELPDSVDIDVGFASYRSRIEVQGSKLRYWREYVVRELSVPPEKFPDWAKLQGVIGADESAAVILKRVQ